MPLSSIKQIFLSSKHCSIFSNSFLLCNVPKPLLCSSVVPALLNCHLHGCLPCVSGRRLHRGQGRALAHRSCFWPEREQHADLNHHAVRPDVPSLRYHEPPTRRPPTRRRMECGPRSGKQIPVGARAGRRRHCAGSPPSSPAPAREIYKLPPYLIAINNHDPNYGSFYKFTNR